MKFKQKLTSALHGFTGTIRRFPVTFICFLLSAFVSSYFKEKDYYGEEYFTILFTFIIGAAVYMVLRLTFERFVKIRQVRPVFGGLAVLSAIACYFVLKHATKDGLRPETVVRTVVILFILVIAFIWIPSVKSKVSFSESFMVVFRGFFTVAFYAAVMYAGIALILVAFDELIFPIDSNAYFHLFYIIAFIYAPLHFLSLIPVYPPVYENESSNDMENEKNEGSAGRGTDINGTVIKTEPSRFLEVLVSYIIIPVTVVFTFILLIYIVSNITGAFWKENFIEPLLIAYSITVLTVYLLASVMKNRIAEYFGLIFPKILIPVVLFQTISSVIKATEEGITAGRYYVILFGIFATVSAVIFSFRPNRRNDIIAPILIILSLISVIPPTDAFLISRRNQISRLTETLVKNDMLKDGKIKPDGNISRKDMQIIINSVQYLDRMNYTKDIEWLKDYSQSNDFEEIFGFDMYDTADKNIREYENYNFYLSESVPFDISDYDYFIEAQIYDRKLQKDNEIYFGENNEYILSCNSEGKIGKLILSDSQKNELVSISLDDIYVKMKGRNENSGEISIDEATFLSENDNAALCLIVKNFNYNEWDDGNYQNIEAFIMIKIK